MIKMSEAFEPFTFIAKDGLPYRVMKVNEEFWVHYYHPDNKWVTITQIDCDRVCLIPNNLTPAQQSAYPE